MPNLWNDCRFYAGKLSLLLVLILDTVDDLRYGVEDKHKKMLDENNGFGPISKPRDEEKRHVIFAEVCVIVVGLIMLMIHQMFPSAVVLSISDMCDLSVSITFSIIITGLIRRCCLFAEEIRHVEERHMGDCMKAFKAGIRGGGELQISTIFVLCIGYMTVGWINDGKTVLFPVLVYIIASTCGMIFIDLLNIKRISDVEVSEMNEAGTKNVAAGLAWSYYFGYLKIILPEFLNTFQMARGHKYKIDDVDVCDLVPVKNRRLYIIIPRDAYCYRKFEALDDRISQVMEMPKQERTRGGVQQRTYSNTLYKIVREGESARYVVMAYISNLSAMYDMSIHTAAKFSVEDKRKQVVEYYKTLNMILSQDPECSGRAQIILIGDASTAITNSTATAFDGNMLGDIICDHLDCDLSQ